MGSNIGYTEIARLGLLMHIGRKDKYRKQKLSTFLLERIFNLGLLIMKKKIPHNSNCIIAVDVNKNVRKFPLRKQKKIINKCYDKAVETDDVIIDTDGFISFTNISDI